MPLPRPERDINLLTEGWPGDPEDFELSRYAATLRADRPELSAPAMDRIGRQMQGELARLDCSAARRVAVRAMVLRLRRFAPIAAAAMVALAVGARVYFHGGSSTEDRGTRGRGVPVIHPAPSPDAPAPPAPPKPIVN